MCVVIFRPYVSYLFVFVCVCVCVVYVIYLCHIYDAALLITCMIFFSYMHDCFFVCMCVKIELFNGFLLVSMLCGVIVIRYEACVCVILLFIVTI